MQLVTIITPARNTAATIEATLGTVKAQDHGEIEHIVIDGASTDGTAEIARRFGARVVSEADAGIYEAMNKGIALARGEWLLFLGADDRLADRGAIRSLVEAAGRDTLLVFGDARYDNGFHYHSRLNRSLLFHNSIHHQASLYRRSVFRDFRYRTDIPGVADYELNLMLYRGGAAAKYVPRVIALCGAGGQSSAKYRWRNTLDLHRVRSAHVSRWWNMYATSMMMVRSAARILLDRGVRLASRERVRE